MAEKSIPRGAYPSTADNQPLYVLYSQLDYTYIVARRVIFVNTYSNKLQYKVPRTVPPLAVCPRAGHFVYFRKFR